jgi:hypothetical protein
MLPLRRTPSRLLTALLLASVLVAASCSSGSDVDATDTTTSTTAAVDEAADATGAEDDDVLVESEIEAMGEDDTDPTAGTTEPDDTVDDPGEGDEGASGEAGDGDSESAPIDDAALAAALRAGEDDALKLPFLYVTADQDCDGCASTVSLYYIPGVDKASVLELGGAFVDGAPVDVSEVDPILAGGDPRLVAVELAAAISSSAPVEYGIDPVSGLVTSWTIDGNTVTLRCLQVDTRPIDMRSEVCRDSLIG